MKEAPGLGGLTLLGVLLIIMGVILLLVSVIIRMGIKLENIHPLLLIWKKFNGFYIGTSPILLIILLAIYILFFLKKF